jgi:nucleoside-diphosphate-sugar epimerase
MKIAITGSSGIIGRELLGQLYSTYQNAEFILIIRNAGNKKNIPRIINVTLDLLSITPESASHFFKKEKVDYFFHLAWDTNHSDYLVSENNQKWESSSIILINQFYINGGLKFIGIGSSLEYDWNYPSPFQESESLLSGNTWKYGQTKLNVYKHLVEKSKEISYLWCRVFFVFGPGQGNSRFIPLLINNALYGGPSITANTDLKRDYISTFEIAKQIIMMFQTDYSGPVNISSGNAIALSEIITTIEAITCKDINLSKDKYNDNFEIKELYGSIDIIKLYFPEYAYQKKDFENDIKKVISIIQNSKSNT